jgi:hypothetical protein
MNLLLLLGLLTLLRLITLPRLHHVLGRIYGSLVDTVPIPHAVAITVRLAALDLGPVLCAGLVAAASLSASLREPVERQKNHGSGKECAVLQ